MSAAVSGGWAPTAAVASEMSPLEHVRGFQLLASRQVIQKIKESPGFRIVLIRQVPSEELVLVQAADGMGDYAMPLRALLKGQAFGPDEIAVLTQAFEQCLVELNLANRKDPATQLVAKAIFDAAKQGERDPKRLSEIATKALSK